MASQVGTESFRLSVGQLYASCGGGEGKRERETRREKTSPVPFFILPLTICVFMRKIYIPLLSLSFSISSSPLSLSGSPAHHHDVTIIRLLTSNGVKKKHTHGGGLIVLQHTADNINGILT